MARATLTIDNLSEGLQAELLAALRRHDQLACCKPASSKPKLAKKTCCGGPHNRVEPSGQPDPECDRAWPDDDETNIEFYADQLAQAIVAEVDDVDLLDAVTGEYASGCDNDSVYLGVDDVPADFAEIVGDAMRNIAQRLQKRLARRVRDNEARCKSA